MAYTDIDKPTDYFNTKLYTGNGSTQSITGVGFQPDWVWIKNRSRAPEDHVLYDAVRGVTKRLEANTQDAEDTKSNGLTSFDSDGFTVGSAGQSNYNGDNIASWNWLASNTTASNTDGSITSTVSANTTSGFSIVSYTGNGTDGATVGHGLTSPKLILIKARSNNTPWIMYGYPNHPSFSTDGSLLQLESTSAMADSSTKEASIGASTVTFVDAGGDINASGVDFVMYCFQEKKGFSKFGSYTGNGNDNGTFVYTGFKPAWLMVKDTTNPSEWVMYDIKRNQFNVTNLELEANTSDAEANISGREIDILSNGFKLRGTSGFTNFSGSTYIYMCFAENPFVTSTGIPTTAR